MFSVQFDCSSATEPGWNQGIPEVKCGLLQKGFPLSVKVPARGCTSSLSSRHPSSLCYGPFSAGFPLKAGCRVQGKAGWAWSHPDTRSRGGQDMAGTQRMVTTRVPWASACGPGVRLAALGGRDPLIVGRPELPPQWCRSSAGTQARGYLGRSKHRHLEYNPM